MKKISEQVLFDGKWLTVFETVTENRNGERIRWETVKRKQMSVGVILLARLMPSERFILLRQWRPNAGGYVIGLPAGLAHGDLQHALIELKEETGFSGRIVSISPLLKAGAGILHDNANIVTIEVDETDDQNQNPQQQLEPAEEIDVCLVRKEDVPDFLKNEQAQGHQISLNVWFLFGYQGLFNS